MNKTIAIKRSIIDVSVDAIPIYRVEPERKKTMELLYGSKDRHESDLLLETANKLYMRLIEWNDEELSNRWMPIIKKVRERG